VVQARLAGILLRSFAKDIREEEFSLRLLTLRVI
jgi:hypothetical protein